MKGVFISWRRIAITALTMLLSIIVVQSCAVNVFVGKAMPFYDLQPKKIVLRSEFSTRYLSSTEERKFNVNLASKTLDNTLVDINGEFSFNLTIGERTEKRGYKKAKIIVFC